MNWKKNEQCCKKEQAFSFLGRKEATDPTEKSKHVESAGIIHVLLRGAELEQKRL